MDWHVYLLKDIDAAVAGQCDSGERGDERDDGPPFFGRIIRPEDGIASFPFVTIS